MTWWDRCFRLPLQRSRPQTQQGSAKARRAQHHEERRQPRPARGPVASGEALGSSLPGWAKREQSRSRAPWLAPESGAGFVLRQLSRTRVHVNNKWQRARQREASGTQKTHQWEVLPLAALPAKRSRAGDERGLGRKPSPAPFLGSKQASPSRRREADPDADRAEAELAHNLHGRYFPGFFKSAPGHV